MKNRLKSFFILMLAIVCLFAFAACQSPDDDGDNGSGGSGGSSGSGIETGAGDGGSSSGGSSGGSSGSGSGGGGSTPQPSFDLSGQWVYTGKVSRGESQNRFYAPATVLNAFVFDENGVVQYVEMLFNGFDYALNSGFVGTYQQYEEFVVISTESNPYYATFNYYGDHCFRGIQYYGNIDDSYYVSYYERLSELEKPDYVPAITPVQQPITQQQKVDFSGRWEATKFTVNGTEEAYYEESEIIKINPDGSYCMYEKRNSYSDPIILPGFWTFENTTLSLCGDNSTSATELTFDGTNMVWTYTGGTGDECKVFYSKTMGYKNVSAQDQHLVGKWNMTSGSVSMSGITVDIVEFGMSFVLELYDDSTAYMVMTTEAISISTSGFWTFENDELFISNFDGFDDDLFVYQDNKLSADITTTYGEEELTASIVFEKDTTAN